MRRGLALLVVGLMVSTALGQAEGEPRAKPKAEVKRHGASIAVFRDGGSSSIHIPATGDKPARHIMVDGAFGTKTPGEVYLFTDDGRQTPLPPHEVEVLWKQLEAVLLAHYGAEELLKIMLNPPEASLTEEEFRDKLLNDLEFMDRFDARCLMEEIITYRRKHSPAKKKGE
jgi:hypothetical protein